MSIFLDALGGGDAVRARFLAYIASLSWHMLPEYQSRLLRSVGW